MEGENGKPLLKLPDLFSNTKMATAYEVNGSTFIADENLTKHDDTLAHYKLYKVIKMTNEEDESDDEDMTTELDIHTQILPQGVIINSNVFLWDSQWNTITMVDGKVYCCAVCQMYCDSANCEEHINSTSHLLNLNKYKPLKRFDLSVVRKINQNLHCGVCNEIFDIIDYKTHENSKTHEGNLLTAINKVSDLMYDSNIHSKPSNYRKFHISDRNMQSCDRNVQSFDRNVQSFDRNMQRRDRNASSDRSSHTSESEVRNNNSDFHYDANAVNSNNISVYEEFSEDEEYLFEGEEYTTPFEGISYANMARRPRIELPKFLKIDLGTKEVRVKFESWHMITKTNVNKFHCMVCNIQDYIRFKSQHCISCEHVERLGKCTVIRAFEDYLIRKVDDKLYHCGHCNNLQYQNQMTAHIETVHPKKNLNIIDTMNSPAKTPKKTKKLKNEKNNSNKNVTESKNRNEIERNSIINKNIEHKIETNFDIFGDVVLSPFGSQLKISNLSFNFIMMKNQGYYCAICDKACVDVETHIKEIDHIELMTMTPFIRPFKGHLTRAVRGTLHCSLCNKLIQVCDIYDHNMEQPHTTALATALGMRKTHKPDTNTEKNDTTKQLIIGVPNPPPKIPNPSLNTQPIKKGMQSGDISKFSANSTSDAAASTVSPKQLSTETANIKKAVVSQTAHAFNTEQNGTAQVNAGSNINFDLNVKNFGQNPPQAGRNSGLNIYNPTFPIVPLLNSQSLINQFLGAPLSYSNFNDPRAPNPHLPYVPGVTQSPDLNQNIPTSNLSQTSSDKNTSKPKNQSDGPNSGLRKKADTKIKTATKSRNDTIISLENQSDEEEDIKEFDEEELVIVKLKTRFFKISNQSYNTLVFMDDGIRYCFVCSNTVPTTLLLKHVESREHTENIAKNKFVDKYGVQLFRQMYLMYHCAICNELMTRKEVKLHLAWPIHAENFDISHIVLNKKTRKQLKSGIKEYVVGTQKEAIYHNVNEPRISIVAAYQIVPNLKANKDDLESKTTKQSKFSVVKKNKMVIMSNVVMKIDFEHWHGITHSKNATKCIICQVEIRQDEIMDHVDTEYHSVALGRTFDKAYYPALVRQINENTVNCVICNLELPNKESMIHEHVNGRKHNKNQDSIVTESSKSDSYADCYEDCLNL